LSSWKICIGCEFAIHTYTSTYYVCCCGAGAMKVSGDEFKCKLMIFCDFKGFPKRRNLIFMISDGYGPASATLARELRRHALLLSRENVFEGSVAAVLRSYIFENVKQTPSVSANNAARFNRNNFKTITTKNEYEDEPLPLDPLLVGTVRTRSYDNDITDSAAGATAYSCGLRAKNDAVGMSESGPCVTILEAARAMGYKTGIVVNSFVTDATPAAFSGTLYTPKCFPVFHLLAMRPKLRNLHFCFSVAHVKSRKNFTDIAKDQIFGKSKGDFPYSEWIPATDLLFGGGLQTYNDAIKNHESSLTNLKKIEKFSELSDTEDLSGGKRIIGLFDDESMSYELDLRSENTKKSESDKKPSLHVMAEKALRILENAVKSDPNSCGFVLVVEGSLIDIAGHANDPGVQAIEVLEYQKTAESFISYIDKNMDGDPTLLISTSDHETGVRTSSDSCEGISFLL
jgi:alkaline phosphatase